ncbi:hypothetical protein EON81_25385 [bacterium]|nr:MAG: hypothetical protein EON81_25385 [bacterium]
MSHARNVFDKFYEVRGKGPNGVETLTYPVAASQTIKKGDLLKFSASGQTVEQALALPGANSTASADSGGSVALVGMALESIKTESSGQEAITERSKIRVAIFGNVNQFALRIYDATQGSSEAQDLTSGGTYQFKRWRGADAGTWWYALSTAGTGEFVFLKPCTTVEPTETYAPVWLRANTAEANQAS